MPLYEYRCESCGDQFEVIQKFSDQPLTVHDGCGGTVSRLLSAPALQFKGSGWYITDYARKGNGNGSETGKSESGKSESDKKPESGKKEDTPKANESAKAETTTKVAAKADKN